MNARTTIAQLELHTQTNVIQPKWQRIILLLVLGYEAAGALLGGIFLIATPDGRLMDMPVEVMHGTEVIEKEKKPENPVRNK